MAGKADTPRGVTEDQPLLPQGTEQAAQRDMPVLRRGAGDRRQHRFDIVAGDLPQARALFRPFGEDGGEVADVPADRGPLQRGVCPPALAPQHGNPSLDVAAEGAGGARHESPDRGLVVADGGGGQGNEHAGGVQERGRAPTASQVLAPDQGADVALVERRAAARRTGTARRPGSPAARGCGGRRGSGPRRRRPARRWGGASASQRRAGPCRGHGSAPARPSPRRSAATASGRGAL